jgi:putative addiction module component (TIGR02574 family)
MSSTVAEISQTALQLPVQERAALLDRLFDSIDSDVDKKRRAELETQWAKESERRIDAVHLGELKTVDGPETLAKLRRSLQK